MIECSVLKETSFNFYPIGVDENQLYITAAIFQKDADPISACEELYHQIGSLLKQRELHVVQERLFGSLSIRTQILKMREQSLRDSGVNEESPITYIEGNPPWGEGLAGVQLYAVKPAKPEDKVWTIYDDKIPCGRGWLRNGAIFLMLQDVHGIVSCGNLNEQTGQMFDLAKDLLQQQGLTYRDTVRTWIYLSDVLKWYSKFNKVRNEKYLSYGFIPAKSNGKQTEEIYLPASTGIEGSNHHGTAATMDILAIERNQSSKISVVHNAGVKQRSPFRYGSAFSRSTTIREGNNKTIYISGTASISEDGRTLGIDNFTEQVKNTIEVVDSLIKSEGASVKDICQATVFLKHAEDFPEYQRIMSRLGLENIPAVCVLADVCRDELLFEIDGIAVTGNGIS